MIYIPQCVYCKHYRGKEGRARTCDAFPKGIPDVIFRNDFDHREPYPKDNGIRFELSEEGAKLLGGKHPFDVPTRESIGAQNQSDSEPVAESAQTEKVA
jgi:hypothetical protein